MLRILAFKTKDRQITNRRPSANAIPPAATTRRMLSARRHPMVAIMQEIAVNTHQASNHHKSHPAFSVPEDVQ